MRRENFYIKYKIGKKCHSWKKHVRIHFITPNVFFGRKENPYLTEIHVAEGNFIQFINPCTKNFCFPNYPDIHFKGDNEVCGKCFNLSYFNISPSM